MCPYDPNKHHRRSIRLKGYDYSQSGLYFIILICHQRKKLFGEIRRDPATDIGYVHLNEAGKMARDCWLAIPSHFPECKLDEFVIMPDHVHGIIEIIPNDANQSTKSDPSSEPDIDHYIVSQDVAPITYKPMPFRSPSRTIGSVVRGYKIGVTKWFRENHIHEKIWHRDYYDIIIRDPAAYFNIAAYIRNNPSKAINGKINGWDQ